MKTLVRYKAACNFESYGVEVRQGDELLCLGPSQPGLRLPGDARLYKCLLLLDGREDVFVEVYPVEVEELGYALDSNTALSLEHQYARAHARAVRWLSSDSQ